MKHRVEALEGALLDAAVAMAEGYKPGKFNKRCFYIETLNDGSVVCEVEPVPETFTRMVHLDDGSENGPIAVYAPSTDWAQGGPIIDRERISTIAPVLGASKWVAGINAMLSYREAVELDHRQEGPTALIAAMRAFVASKLGDTVELP